MSQPVTAPAPASDEKRFRLPDGSRSIQSPWVWRGLFFMSLVALGLCLTFVAGQHFGVAAAWAVIAAGWFGFSMWLWRQHVNYWR
jgi:hypothetical protein